MTNLYRYDKTVLNYEASMQKIINAVKLLENIAKQSVEGSVKMKISGLMPFAVAEAADSLQTRLFKANETKNFCHIIYEPIEGRDISLTIISRPILPLAQEAFARSCDSCQLIITK